jgi:hypothetical protein
MHPPLNASLGFEELLFLYHICVYVDYHAIDESASPRISYSAAHKCHTNMSLVVASKEVSNEI